MLLVPAIGRAQNWTSSLEGVVLDPTGSPIPGASVGLHNPATGLTRHAVTNDSGVYSFPLLPVGAYEIEVLKPGFAPKTLSGLMLEVAKTLRIDITLDLARSQTSLRVGSQAPLVETASPALGDEIDNRRVSLLPLNGRQFSQLALLAAGAAPPYPNGATQQFNTAAQGIGFSVNGQRSER